MGGGLFLSNEPAADEQPRVFLECVPAVLPSGRRKYVIGLATVLIGKKRVFNIPKLYKEILGMNFAKHYICTAFPVFLKPPTRSWERTGTTEPFLEGRDFLRR